MGVIIRQSIKTSILSYLLVVVGALSTLFIYPLDKEVYGLVQFLLSTAMLIMPFVVLGATFVNIKFFPLFKSEDGHRGFYTVLHLLVVIGFFVTGGILLLSWEQIELQYADNSQLIRSFLPYALPLSLLIGLTRLNGSFASNFGRITIPTIFYSYIKLGLPFLILGYYLQYISLDQVIWGVLLIYILAAASAVWYVFTLDRISLKIDTKFLNRQRIKDILVYAQFGAISGVGSVVAFRIDSFMISTLVDLTNNGVYTIALFIGNVITIPATAVIGISGPIISNHLEKNEIKEVGVIYQKASDNLLFVGLAIFFPVVLSVTDLFSLMPKSEEMAGGWWVVFFIGLAKLVEMVTSINHQIINYSSHYRFNLYAILLLAVLNVGFNILFIGQYGIIGAAVATMISLTIYNLIKVGYIYSIFKISPLSKNTLLLIILGCVSALPALLMPEFGSSVLRICLRSTLFFIPYLLIVFYVNLVPDIKALIMNRLTKL